MEYPVERNQGASLGAVVQYDAPNTNGHYVVFNQDGARHQFTCFAATVGTDEGPVLPAPGALDAPCR